MSSKAKAFCIVWPLQLFSTNALAASTCSRACECLGIPEMMHTQN